MQRPAGFSGGHPTRVGEGLPGRRVASPRTGTAPVTRGP